MLEEYPHPTASSHKQSKQNESAHIIDTAAKAQEEKGQTYVRQVKLYELCVVNDRNLGGILSSGEMREKQGG